MRSKFYDLDFDERAPYLYGLAEAKGFPLIQFEESTEVVSNLDDDDWVPDYSGTYVIDTSLLKEADDFSRDLGALNYVGDLIEKALMGWTDNTTSRKYSFGDTPDWWDQFTPATEEGREKILFNVGVYY